jgi:YD repeat-containing protein
MPLSSYYPFPPDAVAKLVNDGGGNTLLVGDGASKSVNGTSTATVVVVLEGGEYAYENCKLEVLNPGCLAGFLDAAQAYTYDGSGNLITEAITYAGSTYTRTYTYTGANLTAVSAWVVT